ncbi:MAG: class I SAM-dependent methyltransferase [Candidatus Vogelbacteria bacterium]|nr:class I SAM-dependent methyltransferase [Candidatus Vogelbacteria bacterium]
MSDYKDRAWIHSFFGGKRNFYKEAYEAMGSFSEEQTEREVDGILKILKPEKGAHILDWCGGWGRHSIPLAKRGYKITLLDFCPEYLEQAKVYAEKEDVQIETVHCDFRETPASVQADFAINLFTAGLGYLGDEGDAFALKSLFHALKPYAKVLIDTVSLFGYAKNYEENNWKLSPDGQKRYLQKRTFNFWNNFQYEVNTFQEVATRNEESAEVQLKIYCPADLSRILKSAGFAPQELFGNVNGSKFDFDSRRLVMTAQKPK